MSGGVAQSDRALGSYPICRWFKSTRRHHFLFIAALITLSFAAYSNSFFNRFLLDDHSLFSDPRIQNIRFLPIHFVPQKLLANTDFAPTEVRDYFRPLAHIVPMIAFQLFGQNAVGHHVFNWVLLVSAGFLVYRLFNRLQHNQSVSAFASILFCIHPINGMLVNYVSANVFIVQILAMTASVLTVLPSQARQTSPTVNITGILLFVVALLCHETAIMLPLYLTIILFFTQQTGIKRVIKSVLPFMIIVVIYLVFRFAFSNFQDKVFGPMTHLKLSPWEYTASFAQLLSTYLSGLLFLKNIVLFWTIPTINSNIFVWNLLFWGIITLTLFIALRVWKRDIKTLGLIWFIAGFIPVTIGCLNFPQAGLLIEPHWLFFPSLGFFLLMAVLISKSRAVIRQGGTLAIIFALITIAILVSHNNNRLWSDELKYCQYWYAIAPNPRSATFLAAAYQRNGANDKAEEFYNKSFRGNFDDWKVYHNLGLIAQQNNKLAEAENKYRDALNIHPQSAITFNNLGLIYLTRGNSVLAEQNFLSAIAADSLLMEPRLNLAKTEIGRGEVSAAIKLFDDNLRISPDDEKTLADMTELFFRIQRPDKAQQFSGRLLKTLTSVERMVNIGSLFASAGFSDLAYKFYSKALSTDSEHPLALIEAGKWYANQQNMSTAVHLWQKVLLTDPANETAISLIEKANHLTKPR